MYRSKVFSTDHRDLIHDVAFNFHGTQLATCSSDQTVKVWCLDPSTKSWSCQASWKAHSGSVWKVTWAHPEFGKVLATCSFDRTASIWEELPGDMLAPGLQSQQQKSYAMASNADSTLKSMTHWVKKASLVDSRTSVTDVKFAPKHHGLQLATCSADGQIRIYDCTDIMNLAQWTLLHEISTKMSLSCISWNPTIRKSQPPMLAVGSDEPNRADASARVLIYEYSEETRRWTKVESLSSVTDPVHEIAFAPNVGRSYNVLGVATSDLRIITLKQIPVSEAAVDVANAGIAATHSYEIKLAGQYNEHASTVWRVCWNVTGTILASSGDDGQVRLWKSNYLDNWKCVANLRGDGSSESGPAPAPPGMAMASAMGQRWQPA